MKGTSLSILFVLGLGVVCFAAGYVLGTQALHLKAPEANLLERTERFQAERLSCVDPLKPLLISVDRDTFVVLPSETRYTIFGLSADGLSPTCTWTAADITPELISGCKEAGITNAGSGQKTVE